MKSNEYKKAITVLALVSTLALMALVFPFPINNDDTTGMVSGTQRLRTVPYPRLYEESKDTPYTYVQTKNPCKAVQCSRPVADAHPVLDIYGKPLTDEYGRVWCKCDGLAELYYRVETTRKY